jgi:aromatic-L-amino-acid decarboxylase
MAQQFARWVEDDRRFELAAPAPLNLVCFRHQAGDDFNRRLLQRLNDNGQVYLTHTVIAQRFTLRFCVGQTNTRHRHVRQAWQQIQETAAALETEIPSTRYGETEL